MSQEDVRTLVRYARKYPQYSGTLLEIVEQELINGANPAPRADETVVDALVYPIEVFHYSRGKRRHPARLYRDRSIVLNGIRHDLPSPAAMSITGNSVNGWVWWYYEDPVTGIIQPIDHLRVNNLI